jgi:peptidyl-prolyl cis-trans isomerase B (cyclophilin B)
MAMTIVALLLALGALQTGGPARQFFVTALAPSELENQQAVVETSEGVFVIDLLGDAAPNHVGLFVKHAREGVYDGTTFHRAVRLGMVQGGDPVSKDPAKRAQYGTGGLRMLQAELTPEPQTRGAVSAVQIPGDADSAGAQFFINVADQPALQGKYTVFGRVSEGIEVVSRISEAPVDAAGKIVDRVEIRRVTIRARPPEPFTTESVTALAAYRAVIETSLGAMTVEFLPDKAPDHVRNFLRLAEAGVYDGMAFHRVAPGFVIQTGFVPTRKTPLTQAQTRYVRTLGPEFNDTVHIKGIVSMARGDDAGSASTSFFICTAAAPALDGKYTAFGRVVDGVSVVEAIEQVPRNGEEPVTRVELIRVRVERQP